MTYHCPECEHPIPNTVVDQFERFPPVTFSKTGPAGSSKTCTDVGLFDQLERVGEVWKNFEFSPADEANVKHVNRALASIRTTGELPGYTAQPESDFPEPAIIRFVGIPGIGRLQMGIYDIAGEAMMQSEKIDQYCGYLLRSKVIVWFVSLEKNVSQDLMQQLMAYREGILGREGHPTSQSVLIVITKGDELADDHTLPETMREILNEDIPPSEGYTPEFLDRHSTEVEKWLEEDVKQHQFVRRFRNVFGSVHFCVSSALGSKPTPENKLREPLMPRGVLLPLYWLARLQLPQISVSSGDPPPRVFYDLEDALRGAEDGSEIRLADGTYRLDNTLKITKSVSLMGSGYRSCRIQYDGPGELVTVQAPRFRAQGIEFLLTSGPDHVAEVFAEHVEFERCVFRGATRDVGKRRGGVGLKLHATTGFVKACKASENHLHGMAVRGDSEVVVERNTARRNGSAGILLTGEDNKSFVRGNDLTSNKFGIAVTRGAKPNIELNDCYQNHRNGLLFEKASSGVARGNRSYENGRHGVLVRNDALPTLMQNEFYGNADAGIMLCDEARGLAEGNDCHHNENGAVVEGDAAPSIIENTISNNNKVGMDYRGNAGGSAHRNMIEANGLGVSIADTVVAKVPIETGHESDNILVENVADDRRVSASDEDRAPGDWAAGLLQSHSD